MKIYGLRIDIWDTTRDHVDPLELLEAMYELMGSER